MKYGKYFLISLIVIIIDHVVKLVVHYNMELGQEIPIFGDWFKLHYTENAGMAFGLELDWEYGKIFLTVFRLVAMGGIAYYLFYLIKNNVHKGLVVAVAFILGGAMGNVIDSIFYGYYLNNAPPMSPTPWFHGKVVDMFYFDIWAGYLPDWIPFMGGQFMALWPIFNIADASIFCSVIFILIFQKRFFESLEPIPAAEIEA